MTQEAVILNITGLEGLQLKLANIASQMTDMRPLFEQFSADFYKDEKRIFQLKGPGQYQDLKESTKAYKERKYGFTYPILFATGRLAASLLARSSKGSVNRITRDEFEIGTSVEHGKFLHEGTSRMSARPIFEDDPKSRMFERWNRMADVYIDKLVQGLLE